MGITITRVKVFGLCSKHAKDDFDISLYKDGTIVKDEDIVCVECNL